MSLNYAAGLSPYPNKGKLGIAEVFDDASNLEKKCRILADLIASAKHLVIHTGAGISTSAGIPDFRGPKGVWTLESKGEVPDFNVSFEEAKPTLTHMALVALETNGFLKYLITQNIDGLHLRSGFARNRLSILHGDMFTEECESCCRNHIRETPVETVGLKFTNRFCGLRKDSGRVCRGKLRDTILDWEHELPYEDLTMAEYHSSKADLNVCLGTSLQIIPACNFPLLGKKKCGGKLVIVNLQPTKFDKKADLVIHAKVDDVMQRVLSYLQLQFSVYSGPRIVQKSLAGSPERPAQLLKWLQRRRKQEPCSTKRKKSRLTEATLSSATAGQSQPNSLKMPNASTV